MRTFRFKIFISYLVLLSVFLISIFLFIASAVNRIVISSMSTHADELIDLLKTAPDDQSLMYTLKERKHLLFFRIVLLNSDGFIIFDSQNKRDMDAIFIPQDASLPPEVKEAKRLGVGYAEEYSFLLGQRLVFLAKSFDFQGKQYFLRLAFPQQYIKELKANFEWGFLFFSSIVLVLFSLLTGVVIYHFTVPIRKIIQAIQPYQEGKSEVIPEIKIHSYVPDEFSDLATTINLLSTHIKNQIETLTHERNEKESILQSLAEGVLAVDCKNNISYANSMALSFLDLDKSSFGKPFFDVLPQKYAEYVYRCKNQQEQNELFSDVVVMQKDGKDLYLNVVVSFMSGRGVILVLQDQSIHHKILEMRKQFIANASHELKTPITIIRGFAETLYDNPSLSAEIIKEVTCKIVGSCKRMTDIIKKLLTLADIENLPHHRLQECDIAELANLCKNTIDTMNPHANITLYYSQDDSYIVEGDYELLEVAILNLLENAVKYSKEMPEVSISLEKVDSHVTIKVQDKGIGIPEHDIEYVFQRFYTVNKAHSKKLGGSGLGLSIVETIVEKHMGKIQVESKVGVGSTFAIILPCNLSEKLYALN